MLDEGFGLVLIVGWLLFVFSMVIGIKYFIYFILRPNSLIFCVIFYTFEYKDCKDFAWFYIIPNRVIIMA